MHVCGWGQEGKVRKAFVKQAPALRRTMLAYMHALLPPCSNAQATAGFAVEAGPNFSVQI